MLARNRAGIVATLEASFTDTVINLIKEALQGLHSGSWQLEMCRTCTHFLVQLSHDGEGKQAILEANAIPTLAKLLNVKDEKTVMSTVHALMGVTVAPQGKVPTVQVHSFPTLVLAMTLKHTEATEIMRIPWDQILCGTWILCRLLDSGSYNC